MDTITVSVVTKVVRDRAGQSVTVEGQAVMVDVRVLYIVEVVMVTLSLEATAVDGVVEPLGTVADEDDTVATAEGDEGMTCTLDDPEITGTPVELNSGAVDLEVTAAEDGDTETAIEEDEMIRGVLDGLEMIGTLVGDQIGELDWGTRLEGIALLGSKGVEDFTQGELGLIGRLEGDDTATLDTRGAEEALGVAVVAATDGDGVGVDDGLTEGELTARELGMTGRLEGDGVATLDDTGTDEALGVVILAEPDEAGVGTDDGFTDGELEGEELGVGIGVEVEVTVVQT